MIAFDDLHRLHLHYILMQPVTIIKCYHLMGLNYDETSFKFTFAGLENCRKQEKENILSAPYVLKPIMEIDWKDSK